MVCHVARVAALPDGPGWPISDRKLTIATVTKLSCFALTFALLEWRPFSSNIWSTNTEIPVKSNGVKSLWTSLPQLHLSGSWREGETSREASSEWILCHVSRQHFPVPLRSPLTSSSSAPGKTLLWFAAAQSVLRTHHPRFKHPHTCMRMHTRWPWCLVDRGAAEIWLCWISEWTLIEFPAVPSCDTACPNAVHLKWKGTVMHGKHYFKGHCCCFGWISMLLSDWDTVQHQCMGLILEQRLQPQARFDPLVQAEGHSQDVSEAELHLLFIYLVLHGKKICILTITAPVVLLLFPSHEFYFKRLVRCFRNHLCH